MRKPRTKPTFKEKKFAQAYIKHNGNGAKAALEAYDTSKKYAHNVAHITLKKPIVQETINKLLIDNGLDLNTLNGWGKEAIEQNLKFGKHSQQAAISMLQFYYKLHNVMPTKVSIKQSYTRKDTFSHKPFEEAKTELKQQATMTQQLLTDLES